MNKLQRAALGAILGFSVLASFESEAKALGPVDVEIGGQRLRHAAVVRRGGRAAKLQRVGQDA